MSSKPVPPSNRAGIPEYRSSNPTGRTTGRCGSLHHKQKHMHLDMCSCVLMCIGTSACEAHGCTESARILRDKSVWDSVQPFRRSALFRVVCRSETIKDLLHTNRCAAATRGLCGSAACGVYHQHDRHHVCASGQLCRDLWIDCPASPYRPQATGPDTTPCTPTSL